VFTPDGRFTDVNDSACRYLGYTRDELLQMQFADIVGNTVTWKDEQPL